MARIVVNTAQRMFYPFLPTFSRGLGVPAETLTAMLSLRGAFGVTAPVFGSLGDRFGRRNAMLIGLGVFCAGLALAAAFPGIPAVFAAMMLIAVCKFLFDPAIQAYLSEHTPYSKRGLVIGLAELGWSGAVLVGVPLLGLLIARGDWRSPFLPLAGGGLLAGLWILFVIPADAPRDSAARRIGLRGALAILRNPSVFAALAAASLISAANESLGVIYGRWLEGSFGLSIAQLGLTTTVIGVAELIAEGGVAAFADRWGKRRTLALGLAVSALSYFALPLAGQTLAGALAGIFGVYLTFEFAIVASLPLISELVPESRGTVMSLAIAFHAVGRMLGALLGGGLFRFGFGWSSLAAGLLTAIGLPLVLWVVRERE